MNTDIDFLVREAVFGTDGNKKAARQCILGCAKEVHTFPASIYKIYKARGREEIPTDFTVPALNLRGMTYDVARILFQTAKKLKVGVFIFELARSEMGYTDQMPGEFAAIILAAAVKESWNGPVFIQGDHFQTKSKRPGEPAEGEINAIENLIEESIGAGFYNIDIDTSTLVDLEKNTEAQRQKPNFENCAYLTNFIRSIKLPNTTISVGGEIGHIGGKNSTVEDFEAFMRGFEPLEKNPELGLSKISVQTGTSHGGIILPNGSLAEVNVDFSILKSISKACRQRYQMAGCVQHGASTLPDDLFYKFPETETAEIHLSTGIQNLIFDHESFPKDLLTDIYTWLEKEELSEMENGWTEEQFRYKLRKKAWGKFKKEIWSINESTKQQIGEALAEKFTGWFKELNVTNTFDLVSRLITK